MNALFLLLALSLTGCSSLLSFTSEPDNANTSPAPAMAANTNKTPEKKPEPEATKNAVSTSVSVPEPAVIKPFIPVKELKVGAKGEDVLAMKKQLAELHYDVGLVDDVYDQQTKQGVMAFQKYNQLARTGTYTLETQKFLYLAKKPDGTHPELGLPRIEIDLTRQVLLFFDTQGLNRVIPVSSGTNRKYCEISKKSGQQVCGVAHTPRGQFAIQSRIHGKRESDLGVLFNPLYFNGGFAIHGSPSVPNYNASHGCVRIPIETSVWFYQTVPNDTPVIVFD